MRIIIDIVPKEEVPNGQLGDYYNGHIYVADTGVHEANIGIALHELVEMTLAKNRGISEEDITNFDLVYKGDGEPGDDVKSPYRKEHRFAENIERLFVQELRIAWQDYENLCNLTLEK